MTTASLFMPFRLKKLRKYDFIHCGDEEAGQSIFFCRPLLQCPIIYDVHGDVLAQSALANKVRSAGRTSAPLLRVRAFHRMALEAADHLLVVSTPQKEAFIRSGIPAERITLVRNGVDLNLFRYVPLTGKPDFSFGYVGGFQTWQGIDNLVKAFETMPEPRPRMLMVGFGKEDQPVKRAFQEKFGSAVHLVDRTDQDQLVGLLRSVSIFIIPRIEHQAIRHAFPTKFAEYAALGRPVMVNDVDETANFVNKYGCGWVSGSTPESMARSMMEAAAMPGQMLEQMGDRARKMAEENFSWERICAVYAGLLRNIVSSASRKSA